MIRLDEPGRVAMHKANGAEVARTRKRLVKMPSIDQRSSTPSMPLRVQTHALLALVKDGLVDHQPRGLQLVRHRASLCPKRLVQARVHPLPGFLVARFGR